MLEDRKERKRAYLEAPRPMGAFVIRNTVNGKVLLGVSLDLSGILNRHRFQLRHGSHPNRALQADWGEFGEAAFAFEILDELKPKEGQSPAGELAVLEALWLEKLRPWGDRGYHNPPKELS